MARRKSGQTHALKKSRNKRLPNTCVTHQTLCQTPDAQLGAAGQAYPPQPCGPKGQEGLEARKLLGPRPDGWRPPRGPAGHEHRGIRWAVP